MEERYGLTGEGFSREEADATYRDRKPRRRLTPGQRLELAGRLFREFHARCFWHCPRELEITEDLLPFVIKGLRDNGGRRGFVLAGMLR